jgi:DivIVA domain-containing protein
MKKFTITLRGYDIRQVDHLIAVSEKALSSDDIEFRRAWKATLSAVQFNRRIRGYARGEVDRAIKDLVVRLA